MNVAQRRERAIGSIPANWADAIGPVASPSSLTAIADFIADQRDTGKVVLPDADRVFAALDATPFDLVRAVIVGQDPYPDARHAMGLAFSVPRGLPPSSFPRSLLKIRAELQSDGGWAVPDHGSLEAWTEKGVLLLNTTLTVEQDHPGGHRRAGWSDLTDAIVSAVAARSESVAFLLWGRHAQMKGRLVTARHHVVVCSPHPVARSRNGFRNSEPFSRANDGLERVGAPRIDWSLTDPPSG